MRCFEALGRSINAPIVRNLDQQGHTFGSHRSVSITRAVQFALRLSAFATASALSSSPRKASSKSETVAQIRKAIAHRRACKNSTLTELLDYSCPRLRQDLVIVRP